MALRAVGGTGKVGPAVVLESDTFGTESFVGSERLSSNDEEPSCTRRRGHSDLAAVVLSTTSNFELQAARSCASYNSEVPSNLYYRLAFPRLILT